MARETNEPSPHDHADAVAPQQLRLSFGEVPSWRDAFASAMIVGMYGASLRLELPEDIREEP